MSKQSKEASVTKSSTLNSSAAVPRDVERIIHCVNELLALPQIVLPPIVPSQKVNMTLDAVVDRLTSISKPLNVPVPRKLPVLEMIDALINHLLAHPNKPPMVANKSQITFKTIESSLDKLLARVSSGAWNSTFPVKKTNLEGGDGVLVESPFASDNSNDASFSSDSFDSNLIDQSLHAQINFERREKEAVAKKYEEEKENRARLQTIEARLQATNAELDKERTARQASNAELEKERAARQTVNAELEKERTARQTDNVELDEERASKKALVTELKHQEQQLDKERTLKVALVTELKRQEEQLSNESTRLQVIGHELDKERTARQAANAALEKERAARQTGNAELDKERTFKKAVLAELKGQKQELDKERALKVEIVAELNRQEQELAKGSAQLQVVGHKLDKERSARQSLAAELKHTSKQNDLNLQKATRVLQAMKDDHDQQEGHLQTAIGEITRLQNEKASLVQLGQLLERQARAEVARLNAELSDAKTAGTKLTKERDDVLAQLTEVTKQLTKERDDAQSHLQAERRLRHEESQHVEQVATQNKNKYDTAERELRATIRQLEQDVLNARATLDTNRQLQHESQVQQALVQTLENEKRVASEAAGRMEQVLQASLQTLEHEKRVATDATGRMEQMLHGAEVAIAQANEENARLRAELEGLQQRVPELAHLQASEEEGKRTIKHMGTLLEQSATKISELQAQMQEARVKAERDEQQRTKARMQLEQDEHEARASLLRRLHAAEAKIRAMEVDAEVVADVAASMEQMKLSDDPKK